MAEKEYKKNKEEVLSRGMPNNIEAEQAVLCSILIDNNAADDLVPLLSQDDFYLSANRTIFEAMKRINEESVPIDTVSLADKLTMMGKLDEVGSVSYIANLSTIIPSAANAQHYVEILKRDCLLRKVIDAGVNITKKGYGAADSHEALQYAEGLIYKISQELSPTTLTQVADASAQALKEIQEAQVGEVNESYIKTGFPTFDKMTRGMKPGELILLAARPSVGKTAFALNIAANVVINDKKNVAMFSLEMPTVQLVKRMLTYIGNVSSQKANTQRGLSKAEFAKIYGAYTQLLNSNFFVDDYSLNGPSDILSKCRRMKRAHGLDLIILDYLQLMETGSGSIDNRQQEVSQMSRRLKIYAKDLGVPILVLSQMSRMVEKRPSHEPMLSDLRESGAIEQDADIVMFLHNPSAYAEGLPENRVNLIIEKHRNGPKGTIELDWNGETSTFRECAVQGGDTKATQKPNVKVEKQTAPIPISGSVVIDEAGAFDSMETQNANDNSSSKFAGLKAVPAVEIANEEMTQKVQAEKETKPKKGLISKASMPQFDDYKENPSDDDVPPEDEESGDLPF
ncbi:MAG TPA: replicative DNA helicase [Clostridia bacterium]|nr:replicative DNA helicase [Clostridia bacterium]